MGLFDVFTGDPLKKAAGQQRAFFDQTRDQNNQWIQEGLDVSLDNLGQGYRQGRGALEGGYNTGRGELTGGFGSARDSINQGYDIASGNVQSGFGAGRSALDTGYGAGVSGVNQGYGDALGYLGQGADAARGAYGMARGDLGRAARSFDTLGGLGQKYGQATSLYQDSLGINGAGGNARASSAFQPSGAYNFNLDQGLEAINRRRAAGGMLNSGNADRDSQDYGAGLASREYGGWQDRLAGFINPELAATSGAAAGRAGAFTGMANVDTQRAGMESALGNNASALSTGRGAMLANLGQVYGQNVATSHGNEGLTMANMANNRGSNLANNYTGQGSALANAAGTYGSALNNSYTGEGGAYAGFNTGAANAKVASALNLAQPYANTYKTEADAKMAGSENIWNFGLNAAKAGGEIAGKLAPLMMLSDRRLKDDVEQVGSLHDGTPVYSFRYKGDERTQIGLMAQDVEKYAPEAVIEVGGFKAVDYRLATERARKMAGA